MHDEVILEGSVLANPIAGREAIRNAMRPGVDGRVRRVVLSHRPLDLVPKFSAALAHRLEPH
jgi:hypothetical protein